MAQVFDLSPPAPHAFAKRNYGKPPKITHKHILIVAESRAKGLSLRHSLALLDPPVTQSHWDKSLAQRPYLSLLYDQSVANNLLPILETIAGSGGKAKPMPVGSCWLLERSMPEIYSTARASQVNVQVNTVVGLSDDIMRRAASVIKSTTCVKDTTTNGGSSGQ